VSALRRAIAFAQGYAAALGLVALVSLVVGQVIERTGLANISLFYLLAVLATAVAFGRGPAVFAAVSSFLIFDWFFVEPRHQFTVSNPAEWVSLLVYLLIATVTGQLAADQRARAREARQREREAVVLYDVVRLLSDGDLEESLSSVAERLRGALHVDGVSIELWQPEGTPFRYTAGTPASAVRGGTAGRVLHTGAAADGDTHAVPGRWVRVVRPHRSSATKDDDVHLVPVRIGDRRVGAVLLANPTGEFQRSDDRLVSAAAAQIGVAMERARLRQEATDAEILRRTDELRRALLNAVSHDLRTPLATIMASAGSLRQQDVAWTEEEREGFAQAIEEEAARLNRLVGNLLDLSRIESGNLRPQKSWHDLADVIDDVVDRLRPVTHERGVTVQTEVPESLPPLLLDSVEIGEVLYNLLENATRYAPPGSAISIEARLDGDHVSIAVSDRGPGIPTGALPHLFDPFYRAIDGRPRPRGLGLGLAIVKGLVEAHGGRVAAENRPGGGARFTFTLPLEDQANAA
jgi:two-component system sensor histidine kinase KdpD